jgi:hypothetical protein
MRGTTETARLLMAWGIVPNSRWIRVGTGVFQGLDETGEIRLNFLGHVASNLALSALSESVK